MGTNRRYQQLLSPSLHQPLEHGGELSIGRRKTRRPVVTRRSMHVVLRADSARGTSSLLAPAHARYLKNLIPSLASRWGVTVYQMANAGNHLHFLLRAKTRAGFQNFLRVLAGKVAQKVTGSQRGRPLQKRFWGLLAYSRVVEWGRSFLTVKRYILQNEQEANRKIPYQPRGKSKPSLTRRLKPLK